MVDMRQPWKYKEVTRKISLQIRTTSIYIVST